MSARNNFLTTGVIFIEHNNLGSSHACRHKEPVFYKITPYLWNVSFDGNNATGAIMNMIKFMR